MPSFQEHINQAKWNLEFLSATNSTNTKFWDWQVTICFYVGLHLVNAHIAHTANLHYRRHDEVNRALNPFTKISPCSLPEDVYLSYTKLQQLSRRSRYLIHDDLKEQGEGSHFTYDRHLSKSLFHLDNLMTFLGRKYSLEFNKIKMDCMPFSGNGTNYFTK